MGALEARLARLERERGATALGLCAACRPAPWLAMLSEHKHSAPCAADARRGPNWGALLRRKEHADG